jgi:MFS family permease
VIAEAGPANPSAPGEVRETRRKTGHRLGFGHLLFLICLIVHFRLAAIGWGGPLLDEHGFRQCQTAISARYMLEDGFRLDYSTPILGRPWSIPFEFPLYQWIVAALVLATHMPFDQAGRLVSLIAFYLTLGATGFFLRHFFNDTERILIVLSLILASPIYIFWSRVFMIESLVLFLSMSFLACVLAALRRHDGRLITAASLLGVLAGLVKITTFLVFCAPAGLALMQAFFAERDSSLKRRALLYGGYGVGLFGPALVAAKKWTDFADAVKSRNPLAGILLSSNLTRWNFGTLQQRLSPDTFVTWARLAVGPLVGRWETLLLLPLAMVLTRPVLKKGTGLCLAGFLAGPLVFSNLYYVHPYYWYANGVFLVILAGLNLVSLFDLRVSKWALRLLIIPVPFAFFYSQYAAADLPRQRSPRLRIQVLGNAVAAVTGKEAVLLTYGFDWDPSLPYYAGRRALMATETAAYRIDAKTHEPVDMEAMEAAIANLKGEPVQAMAVAGPLRADTLFIAERTKRFGLAPSPIFDSLDTAIYVTPAENTPAAASRAAQLLYRYCNLMDAPVSVKTGGPVDAIEIGSIEAFVAPEPSEMVFDAPPDVVSVSGSFGFPKRAYSHGLKTAGGDFSIEYRSGNMKRMLFEKHLDPVGNRADRELHGFAVPVPAGTGGELYFRTDNAQANYAGGLTSWSGIELHRQGK